jgi:hypothetical protein
MRGPAKILCFLSAAVAACACGCASDAPRTTATLNQGAALVGELPMNPLAWSVITSSVDPGDGTMGTLYGNDVAVAYARTHSQQDYPAGSVVSFVRWTPMEDPRWFGAKIPGQVKSVEFVIAGAAATGAPQYTYEAYTGDPLKKAPAQQFGTPPERIAYLLSSRAAVLP